MDKSRIVSYMPADFVVHESKGSGHFCCLTLSAFGGGDALSVLRALELSFIVGGYNIYCLYL